MATPKKKKSGSKRKVKIKKKVTIVRKDSVLNDTIRRDTLNKAPVKNVLPTNGITFKVKIRKK